MPVSRFPEVVQGLTVLQQLIQTGRHAETLDLAEQLLQIEPDNPHLTYHAGLAFEAAGQPDRANSHYQKCLMLDPAHADASLKVAAVASSQADFPTAITVIASALKKNAGNPQLHHVAGQLHETIRHHETATRHYHSLAKLRPQRAAYELLAKSAADAGDLKLARSAYKSAINYGSKPAHIHAALARLEAGHGDQDAAVAHLRTALRDDPSDGLAYLQLANDFSRHIDAGSLVKQAQDAAPLATDGPALPQQHIPMCFAYARLYELQDNPDTAFAYYQRANTSLAAINAYDTAAEEEFGNRVTSTSLEDLNDEAGSQSQLPVFVFGLPRSGTTLLEQIFSAHPDISGLGEHEAFGWIGRYIRNGEQSRLQTAADSYLGSYPRPARSSLRVVDKSMSTPEHLASIIRVFSNAHFIHCERHPMETAWSMYSMYFGERRVAYSNSFEGIAARSAAITRIMEHWHSRLPGRIHTVRYDDLISDMQGTVTRALQNIGLDWDERCADFHNAATMVRTASITQVRQPIYNTASQKWRQYEEHLAPLRELMAPLIEKYEAGR